jgi:hypothetical protein
VILPFDSLRYILLSVHSAFAAVLAYVFFNASNRHGHVLLQFFLLRRRKPPEPPQSAQAVARGDELTFQPGAFAARAAAPINRTAYRKAENWAHHPPVENTEGKIASWRTKGKYYFRLMFATRARPFFGSIHYYFW